MSTAGTGAAANIVGGIIQTIAAGLAQQEMVSQFRKELQRQSKFSNEATQQFHQTLDTDSAENAQDRMAVGKSDRESKYNALPSLGLTQSGQGSARDAQQYQGMGSRLATLGSYGDWQLDRDIANIQTQDKIDKVINFAGGTASVFPYRMNEAQHSQDALSFVGNLISSIGGSAGNWGALFSGPPTNYGQTGVVPSVGGGYNVSNGFDYTPPNVINPATGMSNGGTMFG